jgi:glycosyltransferase involved in cell wall biosynthesis
MTAGSDQTDRRAGIVIVVPCYNEADRLPRGAFQEFASKCGGVDFLLVNDGSSDGTLPMLQGLQRSNPERFGVLDCGENKGKAEAVRRGMRMALDLRPRYAGYWDADLATPLEAIVEFRAVLEQEPDIDVVLGARVALLGRQVSRSPWRHYLGRMFASAASLALRLPVYDTQCGAKLFRVSDGLDEIFAAPFVSRWIFDVEILERYLNSYGSGAGLYELPLRQWVDVGESKVRPKDFARAAIDLMRIAVASRRRRRSS